MHGFVQERFLLRKIHSLSGVVPLGVFLCEHLWTNASALGGRARFDHAVDEIQRMPFLPLIEVVGIFLPLMFHAVYGVMLARESKPNVGAYDYTRNWLYVLQRVSGVIVFVFVMAHLWEYRVQKWLFGMDASSFYGTMEAHFSSTKWGIPWVALGYVLGLAAATFHFANGLWGFAVSWGLTISRRAQARVGVASAALGIGLFLIGTMTVIAMASGSRFGTTPTSDVKVPATDCNAQGK
jgi:succinate dehydrogenase / fumarate reductase, cytochrome b subunit